MTPDPTPLTTTEVDSLEQRLLGNDPIEMPPEVLDTTVKLVTEWRASAKQNRDLSKINRRFIRGGVSPQNALHTLWTVSGGKGKIPTVIFWTTKQYAAVGAIIGFFVGMFSAAAIMLVAYPTFETTAKMISLGGPFLGALGGITYSMMKKRVFPSIPDEVDPAN